MYDEETDTTVPVPVDDSEVDEQEKVKELYIF